MPPVFVAGVMSLLLVQGDGAKPKPAKAVKDKVPVVFRVEVPAGTPKDATVCLSGNLPAAGEWRETDAKAMKRIEDGRYAVTLVLPQGARLEYKITLGSWKKVEKSSNGKDLDNRKLVVNGDELIDVDLKVAAWAAADAPSEPVPFIVEVPAVPELDPTITGIVSTHEKFASKILNNERSVIVWLPPGYADEPMQRYPVFYLQDGQNVFDANTSYSKVEWRADETADRLIRDKKIPPMILVAIANTKERTNEYTYVRDKEKKVGGNGRNYARFLIEELKPFIDKTYRTKPDARNTAIGGASLGGLIAMEITLDHPEVFGRCAVVSPAIWWANEHVIAEAKDRARAAQSCKFWIDMGTNERVDEATDNRKSVDRARRLAEALKSGGLAPERQFHLEIVEGASHHESAWAERFDRILIYLFTP